MFSDVHMHTEFSGDSHTPTATQIEQAISLGMKEICITEHHDYDVHSEIDFTLDLDSYFPAMKKLQAIYADRIRVNIGIELGLQLHIKSYLDHLILQYPFDFIIGSCHFIDGMDPFYPSFFDGRTEQETYEHFFAVTLQRIRQMDCFDVLGHLDYIVRYGPNQNRDYAYATYQAYIDPILVSLIARGKGLECNTGGFKYKLGHPNPSEEILIRYRELGGEILTIGSDAHRPAEVGYEFDRLRELLLHCGFRYYSVFHQRKPDFFKL
ncbi:MAG: histidinol-phosphatase HisJ family protein [Hungatella sp.]